MSTFLIHHTSWGNRTISKSIGEMLLTSQPLSSASLECPTCQNAQGVRMFRELECSECQYAQVVGMSRFLECPGCQSDQVVGKPVLWGCPGCLSSNSDTVVAFTTSPSPTDRGHCASRDTALSSGCKQCMARTPVPAAIVWDSQYTQALMSICLKAQSSSNLCGKGGCFLSETRRRTLQLLDNAD